MRTASITALSSFLIVVVGCSDDPGSEACNDLAGALAQAEGPAVVSLGACTVQGSFIIPPGVTLRGVGEQSAIVGDPDLVAITLQDGAAIESVLIEGHGTVGLAASGDVSITDVEVVAETGIALQVSSGAPTLTRVELNGPVTEANATDVAPMPDSAVIATHGLVLADVGMPGAPAQLSDVSVRGFARFGALLRDSVVRWDGGSADQNLSVGVMVSGGSAELLNLTLCGTLEGIQPLPGYAGVLSNTTATTTNLIVCDNEGYGILHDDAAVDHVDLVGSSNGDVALWVQNGRSLSFTGAASVLSDNRLAGLVLVDTPNATVEEVAIEDSTLATRIDASLGEIMVGDGIHVVAGSASGMRFADVELVGNARVGMLLQVEDNAIADGVLSNIIVDGTGLGLGLVAQNETGLVPDGPWSAAIERRGDTVANDASLSGRLDVLGIVGPMFLPRL